MTEELAIHLMGLSLVCVGCGALQDHLLRSRCRVCGGILEVDSPSAILAPSSSRRERHRPRTVPMPPHPFTMGEGNTPLVPLTTLYAQGGVHAKVESGNPTGSFKDRGSVVASAWARALGAIGLVAASTGNNAASVSAYAARNGLRCAVVIPRTTTKAKLGQSLAAGATLIEVDGTFSDCHELAARIANQAAGWVNATSTYDNPWMTEAHKTIAFELVAQLGVAPGSFIVPIGSGPLLAGMLKGFQELRDVGAADHVPVPVGVQAAGCAPIARAFDSGSRQVEEWTSPLATMAQSIADPLVGYASHGTHTLNLVRSAGGTVIAVEDDAIGRALQDLGEREGIVCEATGATPLAALRALPSLPKPVVLMVTGHGLKEPDRLGLHANHVAIQAAPGSPTKELIEHLMERWRVEDETHDHVP